MTKRQQIKLTMMTSYRYFQKSALNVFPMILTSNQIIANTVKKKKNVILRSFAFLFAFRI